MRKLPYGTKLLFFFSVFVVTILLDVSFSDNVVIAADCRFQDCTWQCTDGKVAGEDVTTLPLCCDTTKRLERRAPGSQMVLDLLKYF